MTRKGITAIYVKDDLGATPAVVNRRTGEVYISRRLWPHIKKEHRLFILLHEHAHFVLNTSDEVKADELAFRLYAERGYSLTEAVRALTQVLNYKNPEHAWRTYLQLERAARYDYKKNNNKALENWYLETFKKAIK